MGVVREGDEVACAADVELVASLALREIVRSVRDRPLGSPLEAALGPTQLTQLLDYRLTDDLFRFQRPLTCRFPGRHFPSNDGKMSCSSPVI